MAYVSSLPVPSVCGCIHQPEGNTSPLWYCGEGGTSSTTIEREAITYDPSLSHLTVNNLR